MLYAQTQKKVGLDQLFRTRTLDMVSVPTLLFLNKHQLSMMRHLLYKSIEHYPPDRHILSTTLISLPNPIEIN